MTSEKQRNVEKFIEGVLSEGASQGAFDKMADYLLKKCQLRIGDEKFYLMEIEFYCDEKNGWKDSSIYKNKKQNEMGLFYSHVSGIDFTFGDKQKERYGGILIRGIKGEKTTPELEYQPTLVAQQFKKIEPNSEKWSEKIALEETSQERSCVIFQGPRVNISDYKPLRYAVDLKRPQKQILLLSSILLGVLDDKEEKLKELFSADSPLFTIDAPNGVYS